MMLSRDFHFLKKKTSLSRDETLEKRARDKPLLKPKSPCRVETFTKYYLAEMMLF